MQLRDSASISTTNNYTLFFGTNGDLNYRLVYIRLQLTGATVWDFYTMNSSENSTFETSVETLSFTVTITWDKKIFYKHKGTPPPNLKLDVYTSPFQINL